MCSTVYHAVILVSTLLMTSVSGYNVLVWYPMPAKSHSLLGEGFVKPLLNAGHNVTYVTPFLMKPHENLTQLSLESLMIEMPVLVKTSDVVKDPSTFKDPRAVMNLVKTVHEIVLKMPHVDEAFRNKGTMFDVVIVEWFFNDFMIGLGKVFNSPVILSPSSDIHEAVLSLVTTSQSPAIAVDMLDPEVPPYGFFKRVESLFKTIYAKIFSYFMLKPIAVELYDKYLVDIARSRGVTMPDYSEAIYNSSFVLYNSHPSIATSQALPGNVRPIGGYHIEVPTKPLPQDLQKLMDSSTEGVIYFSMGSNLKSKDMSDEMKKNLLNIFSKLRQRVIWKFEEDLKDIPKNVHIQKWLPQSSILAHKNTKLFITHGGLLSLTEATHHGVPMVAMPLFGDQFLNALRAQNKGYCLVVDIRGDYVKELSHSINEMLTNPSYTKTVKRLSGLFHDRPLTPQQEVVYWVQHVARTAGAEHYSSSTRSVPYYQIIYLDLILLIVVLGVIIKTIIIRLLNKQNVDINKKNS